MKTPTLDKFNLHPFGGTCTCFSAPYAECLTCKAIKEAGERWKALSEEDRKKALSEMDDAYPRSYDNVNGGR